MILFSSALGLQAAPEILTQPASQTLVEGQNAVFSVEATGLLPLTFQWRNGADDLLDETNSTLTLTEVQATQAGNYSVVVTDSSGSTTSDDAVLTIAAPPTITTQPADRTLNQGQAISLSVGAEGTDPLSYEWWFNGNPLSGPTNATLLLATAQSSQSGSYWAVVSNIAGVVTSRVATVLVIVPPTIVEQPVAKNVSAGDDVEFSVTATGTTPTYQWRFNGEALNGATRATLTLPNVQPSQAGAYQVDVSNAAGTVTSTEVALTVSQAPTIIAQPPDRVVNQGQSINFTVTASGLPAPAYQWWFNGQVLPAATGPTLLLFSAQSTQSGNYWVVVSNLAGVVTSRVATVQVIVPPAIVQPPVAQSVSPGTTVTFSVLATGTAPTYQWKFNGSALSGATDATLKLTSVQSAQAGAYRVDVSNAAGTVTSTEVTLTVYQAPILTSQPLDRVVNLGQSTNLTVTASGFPAPAYQWWFNGQVLPTATSPTLALSSVQSTQSGNYWVVVSNLAGAVTSRVASVQVIVPPAIVQQPVARSVPPGTTVTFSVAATGTAPTYQWKFNGTALGGATNATLTLTSVQSAQAGAYRVDVRNAAGTVTSTEVTLTVYQAPIIISQPVDRVLNLGQNSSLSVTASGNPAPSYQWWLKNTPLSAATNATVSLISVQTNQAGSYWVVVSNLAGVVTSRVASVQVIVPPAIVQQPVAQSVLPGTTVALSVVATGTTPNYQWKFNGSALSGATNATLTLPSVQSAQAGAYKVDVSNAAGAVTSTEVTLTVYQAPTITTQPPDRVLNLGQNSSLGVTAGGIPAPSYRWWFQNAPLSGATNATLSLTSAQTNQAGSYWVVVSNLAGFVTSRVATVQVIVPPAIVQQPASQDVERGTDVIFKVVASGTTPHYQWNYNGAPLANATNATLQLLDVIPPQAGAYSVTVNNTAGKVTSAAATLVVRRIDMFWVHAGSGIWDKPANWSRGQVPTTWDNVFIVSNGTYTVSVSANASVGSLTLGGVTGAQTLSVSAGTFELSTNGISASMVSSNGVFDLSGGLLTGRDLNLAGRMTWSKGEVRSLIRVSPEGHLDLAGNNPKFLSSGVLDNAGSVLWSDLGAFQLGSGAAITNSGLFEVQNNAALTSTNKPAPVFVNSGVLRKTTVSNVTEFGSVELRNRGVLDLQSGGINFSSGKHTLSDGSRVTGAGSLGLSGAELTLSGVISMEAPLELGSGTIKGAWALLGSVNWRGGTINNGGTLTGTLNLLGGVASSALTVNGPVNLSAGEISGGLFTLNGDLNWTGGRISNTNLAVNGDLTWAGGVLSGRLLIPASHSLLLTGAGTRQIAGGILTNWSTVVLSAPATISCDNGASIYNFGTFQLNHDAPFSGGTGNPSRFLNYGRLIKAGPEQLDWSSLELHNLGTCELLAGVLALATNAHSFDNNSAITGPGRLMLNNGSLALGTNVACAPTLEILGGAVSASGAFLGNIDWSAGSLAGVLALGPDRQLHLLGTGTKLFSKDFILNTAGATTVEGAGALLFYANATINNSGDFEIRTGGNFTFNGSDRAWFNNSGTLRKTISTAVLPFAALQLVNRGTVDIQAGSISFTAFTHTLENGTKLTGPGPVQINGATVNLNGTNSCAMPLSLIAGALAGNGTLQGDLTWAGGTVSGVLAVKGNSTWSGGSLSGQLNVPASATLTVASGSTKTISGVLNNDGRVIVLANAVLTLASTAPLVNTGTFEIQYDKPFTATATKPVFQNSGTLLKTGSKIVTDFGAVLLQNSGTLDLQSGDISFSQNSHTFTDGTRTAGSGTVRLTGATLTVNGTATLGAPFVLASGTLAGSATLNGAITLSGGTMPGAFVLNGDASWNGGEISGTLTANGTVDWSSGLLSGTLSLPATARANVLLPGTNSISGTLQNAGTVVVSNNASLQLLGGTPIVNSGLMEVQNETPFKPNGTTKVTLINNGIFRKTTSTKPMDFTLVLLQNSGTLDLRAGEIFFKANTHNLKDGTRITGPGTVHVAGATVIVAGTLTLGPTLSLESGVLDGGATLNGPFAFSGGQVTGNLAVNGSAAWSGGVLKGSLNLNSAGSWTAGQLEGALNVGTNCAFSITGTAQKFIKGGTFTSLGGVSLLPPVALVGDGAAVIQNYGSFTVPGSATVSTTNGRPVFNNYGALSLTNGFGSFSFQGDFHQFPGGLFELELGGRNPGANFSRLIGVNTATLAGTLSVRTVNGFAPARGDRLTILNCAARVGTFASYAANGLGLSPDYCPTNVTLIAEPPSLTTQPQSQTVNDGTTVNFSVAASGTIPMSYRWFWNGTPINSTNSSLTLTNVHSELEGAFTVIVTNVWGAVTSAPASLIVLVAPGITRQPESLTVLQGEAAAFSVEAIGTHLGYQWKSGSSALSGATNATLLFTNTAAANAGKYKVDVRNAAGVVTSKEVTLTVLVPPVITQQPAGADIKSGAAVTLTVTASGTSPLSYQWLKDDIAITGANLASYYISRMSSAQEGTYEVIVANAAGYVFSMPAVLRVTRAPQITTQPLSQSVNRGSNVLLVVNVSGVPTPTFQWQLNGVNLPGATQPILLLTNVQPKDSGKYRLVAANSVGTIESAEAELQVIVPRLPFADKFANRGIIYTASGFGRGTNCGATLELGEPKLAGRSPAPSSVWLTWWAPANGIVTFNTLGSEFDTVLGVFRGSSVNALTKVAIDDDSAGFHCSKISFNAQAGTYYEIVVAGLGNACGDIVLNWNLIQTTELLPEIVEAPHDVTGNTNESVVLQVVFNAFESTAIQWFYQGQILTNAIHPTLAIPSLQEANVGGYSVRLTGASGRTVVSPPGDIQINTEGATGVSARNKFFDGFERALTP